MDVEVTLKDIQILKQDVMLNRLPQWKDSWFGDSTLKDMADTLYFIHQDEDFFNHVDSNRETLVYCGYW